MIRNYGDEAIELARKNYSEGKRFLSRPPITDPFGGVMVVVDYRDEDGDDVDCLVYFEERGPKLFDLAESLFQYLSNKKPQSTSVLEKVVQGFGVPGILAVIITVAVIALAVRDPKAVPEQLWSGLALVLGFYFGSKSKL